MTDMMIRPLTAVGTPTSGAVDGSGIEELDGYLTCVDIADVTHDVRSFTFEVPGQRMLEFLPGQYLTLRLLVGGERVERCYTISSAPTRPERLTITVKRVAGGVVSNWLHDHLAVGDAVGASGPFGQFSSSHHPADRYLFLTAGSGITPAMSMLRTMRDRRDPADVVFVHCARTPDDIVFRSELEEAAREAGVSLVVLCEADSAAERWHGPTGRLTLEALLRAAPDLRRREVFTCGPGPFMDAVRDHLDLVGVDPSRCHEESFVLGGGTRPVAEAPVGVDEGTAADDGAGVAGAAGSTYAIDFRRSGRTVECDSGTTVLEAAARAGLTLPSSCGEGVCGTCKLTLLGGEVDMQHQGGIRPREVREDKFLACCSTPLGDLEVDA